jgi:uncharacterized protein YdeI (YjbR/CyaY-like superfamily)
MIESFTCPSDLRAWLELHAHDSDGFWLRIYKKGSSVTTVTYAEALDEALCFGWIDGQKKPFDESSWLQRFCPRKARGNWSKVNTGHAERLMAEGRMTERGLREVKAAKADGRWIAAYDSPRNAEPPEDFMARLAENPVALAFYHTLNRANVYAIVYRLQTAKRHETRQRRMESILEMLAQGKAFH